MLKLTYTSSGLLFERSSEDLEAIIRSRVRLGLGVKQPLGLEPRVISIAVDSELPTLPSLLLAIAQHPTSALQVIGQGTCHLELQIQGYWLASATGAGMFLMALDAALEDPLAGLWQVEQSDASCILEPN